MKQKTNGRNLLSSAIWCDVILAQQNGTKMNDMKRTSCQAKMKAAIPNGYRERECECEEHQHGMAKIGMHCRLLNVLYVCIYMHRQKTPEIIFNLCLLAPLPLALAHSFLAFSTQICSKIFFAFMMAIARVNRIMGTQNGFYAQILCINNVPRKPSDRNKRNTICRNKRVMCVRARFFFCLYSFVCCYCRCCCWLECAGERIPE